MMEFSKQTKSLCNDCAVRHKTAFKDLKEADCAHIDTLREVKVVKAGNPILFKDKNESAFYCLQQGHVQLGFADKFKAGIVRICGPGDLVGYESTEVTPVAEVIEDSVLCLIKRKPFVEVQKINPDISNGIIQALVRIIAIKNERIIGLENHSVKNRIATTLLSLMKKFGTRSEWGTLIDVKLERKILAKLAGTVVESLARTLTELEDEKIIHRQARQIHVVNKEKLIHFSNQ